jgi:hypothetical protein
MDTWIPLLALFSGLFLQLALMTPQAEQKVARMHPIPGSFERMDRMSWLLIIAGSLWEIQNLLV